MNFHINSKAIILHLSGKDARRYLNARLSNDVKSLTPGNGCYAAALSPQGRAEGYFKIICLAESEFIAICDGGEKERIISAFRRYLVADRVTVTDLSEKSDLYSVIEPDITALKSLLSTETIPNSPCQNTTSEDIYIIATKRANEKSLDLIVPKDKSEDIKSYLLKEGALEISAEELSLYSIKAGIATFPAELNEDVIFSASGLDYAVSFKKGCYVGQEVIEKIDAYGKVPYILKALRAEGNLSDKPEIKFGTSTLPRDKILSRYHDSKENMTYYFVEIKNNDYFLDSEVLIDDNRASFICQK